jgi:hypothetical protein
LAALVSPTTIGALAASSVKPKPKDTTPYCTFALTDAVPVIVNVQVLVLLLPLEQAPDQMASRPFVTLNVIEVLTAKLAEPVVPTDTLMPVGLDVTRSPLRPVALTVNVAPAEAGFTVTVAVRVTPL